MWAARYDQGYVFGDLTSSSVETLKGVPMLIESRDERVRQRLLPETYADADAEQEWQEHAVPELERLFLSRAQLVRRDLAAMQRMPDSENMLLLVPFEHVNAWLAALNAARLALFVLNDMTAEHMTEQGFAAATAKQQEAALRIDMLAEMQAVLLGEFEELVEPADEDEPDEGSDDESGDEPDDESDGGSESDGGVEGSEGDR